MIEIDGRNYLSTDEAADYLGLSSRTLRNLRHEGGGPKYCKAGGRRNAAVRYPQDELDAWVQGRSRDGAPRTG